jgi:hypothetical protein
VVALGGWGKNMLLVRRVYSIICGLLNIGNGSHYIVSNDKVVGK